jgi:predicted Fe-Mo cluster-binding NifX family protein
MDYKNNTIAIATDDGTSISSHFGRAQFYEVLTFVNGELTKRERREKAGHHSFPQAEGEHVHHSGQEHQHRHHAMVASIPDCQAVVVRGMGEGAVEHFRQAHLIPVLTGLHTIDEVIRAVAADSLDHDPRRIHLNHGK